MNSNICVSESHLQILRQELKLSTASAFARGTNKNLKIQWETFISFCLFFNFKFLPTSTQTLQLYAQFLSRTFKAVDSIRNYISGVRTLHACLGYDFDHINNYLINLSLKGIARLHPHAVRRAEPITLKILLDIHTILDFSLPPGTIYWCCSYLHISWWHVNPI